MKFFNKKKRGMEVCKGQLSLTADEANEKGFFFRINGKNCKILSYKGNDMSPKIPTFINGKPVRVIGKGVFAGRNIKAVKIPDTVRIIKEKAFYETALKEVILPESIVRIEDGAFRNCKELRSVIMKKEKAKNWWEVIEVNGAAFVGTPYIEFSTFVELDGVLLRINPHNNHAPIRIPDSVIVIGEEVIKYNWDVEQIEIPKSVNIIKERAFANVYHLRNIMFEHAEFGYLKIEKDAFGDFKGVRVNPFCLKLLRKELASEWGMGCGWKKFHRLKIENPYHNSYYSGIANAGEREIYFPSCTSNCIANSNNKVLQCMNICYQRESIQDFIFSLSMQEYYEIMLNTESLKEQIEMAVCIVMNAKKEYKEKALTFLEEHINKAVHFAVQSNNIYNMKLYQQYDLFRDNLKVRHCEYLIEKYSNSTTRLLEKLLLERAK